MCHTPYALSQPAGASLLTSFKFQDRRDNNHNSNNSDNNNYLTYTAPKSFERDFYRRVFYFQYA